MSVLSIRQMVLISDLTIYPIELIEETMLERGWAITDEEMKWALQVAMILLEIGVDRKRIRNWAQGALTRETNRAMREVFGEDYGKEEGNGIPTDDPRCT